MEVQGDPSGVKMAQDASWIASGAEFGDLLGLKMAQVGAKWRQDGIRWRYVGQLGAQDGQLGASWVIFRILSAILAKIAEV